MVPTVLYGLCVWVRACVRVVRRRNGETQRLSVSNKRDTVFNRLSLLVKQFCSSVTPLPHIYYTSVKISA
jgi:hypothetical protein